MDGNGICFLACDDVIMGFTHLLETSLRKLKTQLAALLLPLLLPVAFLFFRLHVTKSLQNYSRNVLVLDSFHVTFTTGLLT